VKSLLVPAVALLLAAPSMVRAEEPAQIDRLALEGRWREAHHALAAWRTPGPLGRLDLRLDLRGSEVELWRTVWTVQPDGRAALREDDTSADARRAGHRLTARGQDHRGGGSATFPILEALYAERLLRETRGMGDLPTGSPLAGIPDPDGLLARFLAWQAEVYHPVPAERSPDASVAAEARAARERADSLRSASRLWAILSAGLLLALALGLGLWLRPGRPGT